MNVNPVAVNDLRGLISRKLKYTDYRFDTAYNSVFIEECVQLAVQPRGCQWISFTDDAREMLEAIQIAILQIHLKVQPDNTLPDPHTKQIYEIMGCVSPLLSNCLRCPR